MAAPCVALLWCRRREGRGACGCEECEREGGKPWGQTSDVVRESPRPRRLRRALGVGGASGGGPGEEWRAQVRRAWFLTSETCLRSLCSVTEAAFHKWKRTQFSELRVRFPSSSRRRVKALVCAERVSPLKQQNAD